MKAMNKKIALAKAKKEIRKEMKENPQVFRNERLFILLKDIKKNKGISSEQLEENIKKYFDVSEITNIKYQSGSGLFERLILKAVSTFLTRDEIKKHNNTTNSNTNTTRHTRTVFL